ncbi:MAG: MATE family multidrug resistance protein [Oceanicoccus sp.]|jgi:MATE family multidrug resistance protein
MNKTPLKELMEIAVPMVVSQGAFAVMIFTDRLFMSQISPTHMAASLGGGVASFFCLSLFIGVLSYANALVAQYYGAGNFAKCSRVVTQGMILCAMCMPLLFLISFFVSDLFEAMGHDPLQAELEKKYFLVLMWGSFFSLSKTCIASFFSGVGQTRKIMIADTLGVALNIPLTYVLIFGGFGFPELGIVGAGIGTIIGTLFTLLIFVFFYFHRSVRYQFHVLQSAVFDKGILNRFLRLGFPSGLEMFLNVAAFNLFLLMFQSYGVAESASAAIVFNWDIVSFIPLIGLNIAIISLIGRHIGAGNMDKANEVITSGFIIGLGYSAVLAVVFVVFRQPLVDIFIVGEADGQEIRELASYMMLGLASYVMADALILVAGGVLRGAGDTRWLMVASVSLHWVMLIVQYAVIKVFEYGPKASWVIFVCMIISLAAVFVLRLTGQKWRDPETLRQVMAEH